MEEPSRAARNPSVPDVTGAPGLDDPTDQADMTAKEIDQAAALAGARVEHLVENLIEAELETGRREETVEQAKRHIVVRIVRVAAGVVVLLLGIAMLGLPGPGFLVIALGLGLLAQDVPFARRLLDKVRARLPQDADGKLPRSTVIMMVVVGVGAVALSIGFTVWRMSGS
jgi:uncharacterized protein (TIGR02611 family)